MLDDSEQRPFFRQDIQGLRGIAVLLVVIYHSGFALPGGYVGVDVFFVISGFVITQLLIREVSFKETGLLIHFYKRRLKRLLPASSIAVAIIALLSFLVIAPENLLAVSTLARSTLFLGANFNGLTGPGYFSSTNPLEHMWSLAVEEQLYVFYPVLFLVIWRFFGKHKNYFRILASILFSFGIISFSGSVLLSNGRGSIYINEHFLSTPERFAFFMMPTRVWEFFVGALITLIPAKIYKTPFLNSALTLIGFFAILFASISFNEATKFPGVAAVLPVCGTGLIIACSLHVPKALKVLQSRALLHFGAVSYSWYLWHWPAIVFSQNLYPRNSAVLAFAIVLSLIIATFSYKKVESLFRPHHSITTRKKYSYISIAIAFCLLSPFITTRMLPFLEKQIHQPSEYVEPNFSVTHGCHDSNIKPSCVIQNGTTYPTMILVGDSLAGAASDGIAEAAKISRLNFAVQSYSGCPPFPIQNGDGCFGTRPVTKQTIDELNPRIVVVAVAIDRYIDLGSSLTEIPIYITNYLEYIDSLVIDGRQVVVLLEVPKMDISGQKSILKPKFSTRITSLSDQVRHKVWLGMLTKELATLSDVTVINVDTIFCPQGLCNPRQNGSLLYLDPTHLTVAGSRLLTPIFAEKLKEFNS